MFSALKQQLLAIFSWKKASSGETLSSPSSENGDTEANLPEIARDPNTPPKLHALIIGIDKYINPNHVLDGGVADAKEMEKYLRTNFPESSIQTLYDRDATRKGIIEGLRDLMSNPAINRKDPILIFYAGHGGETTPPEDWDTHGQKIQMLMPVDYNDDETFITDIGFARLLEQLASRKGDNVVVILDCCHSGSMTRDLQQEICPNSKSRSIKVTKPLSDKVDEDILGIKGIRAAAVPKGFQYNGTTSHVLLAACGANEFANENNGRGAFTRAFLDMIVETGYDKLTYAGLIRKLPKINQKQTPRCEGVNRDRLFFHPKLPPQGKTFLDVYAEENQVKVRAGAVHGVTPGAEFTLYESPDQKATVIGTYAIKNIKATTCTLDSVNPTLITLPAFALQSKVGDSDALKVSFANKEGMYEMKQTLTRDLDADNSALDRCTFVNAEDAQVEIDIVDDRIVFNIVNSPLFNSMGLTRMPFRIKKDEREIACNIIRAAAHFERYLGYHPKTSTISHQIGVEFVKVARLGRHKWGPASQTGDNLCQHNYVQIVAGRTLYGMKITNNSPVQLYPHLFLFDCSDLSILYYYRPPTVQNQDTDAPLQPNGGTLTIGYGTGGEKPWSHYVRNEDHFLKDRVLQEKQDLDIGVFKLFLTTQPTDLSLIVQKSPFTEDYRAAKKWSGQRADEWDTVSIVVAVGRNQEDLPFPS
ncbi:hypothetical protein CPB86DRAFT_817178 [Serendipita vermifera]|nr:hypothetical protein CPB86DRAFT_817178 [Serendipita vermifera]